MRADNEAAFARRWWYPACRSGDLGRKAVGISLMDTPLVVFRDQAGRPRALLDRCSHRNVALSLGRVHGDGCLECSYHGWRFDGTGHCSTVPGLMDQAGSRSAARDVPAHPTTEQDGFVWVWGLPEARPESRPFALPEIAGRGSGQVVLRHDLECPMAAALENALDVPHTAFLHRGLFRGGDPKEITAVRRDVPGGTEVQYLGEPVRFGALRPIKGDLTFDHWDRFFLPSIAQIEYRVKGWLRLVNTIVHLPLSPSRTRAWFVVRFWTGLPAPVVQPIIAAQGRRILRQDAGVLAQQTDNIRRFGQARYASTELDVMGLAIWRLLHRAARAESGDGGTDLEPMAEDAANGRSITFRA